MRLLLIVALLASPLWSVTLTVCSSGCNYTQIQGALNAASPGDVVELKAGETFPACLTLPWKAGSDYITVRSSRWRELPPVGTRVNPADHPALMPVIQATGTECTLLRAGETERRIGQNGIDVEANTISYGTWPAGALTEGKAITFGVGATGRLPGGLERAVVYYVRNPSGSTTQVSLAPGGSIVDLTSQGSASESSYYVRPWIAAVQTAHHWRFRGIDFQTKPGTVQTYAMIQIGWDETTIASVPHDIEFEQVLVRGNQNEDGPQHAVALNGSNLVFADSWIDHVKKNDGYESHGILMVNTPGPVRIENNFIAAASLGILTGGQGSSIYKQVATGVTIRGNHVVKRGYMLYNSGAGAPTGACYYGNGSGRFYRDTSVSPNTCANGACYVCQPDGTWAQDKAATYRDKHYLPKSGIEFKDCDTCLVEGNVVEGVFAGNDTGNMYCMLTSSMYGGYHVNKYITIRNNWCKDTWSGFVTALADKPDTYDHDITFSNNLATGIADFPAMSIHSTWNTSQPRPLGLWSPRSNVTIDHNTFRPATPGSQDSQFAIFLIGGTGPIGGSYIKNNVIQAGNGWIYVDAEYDCSTSGFGKYFGTATSPKYVANNVLYRSNSAGQFTTCNPVQNLVADTLAHVSFVGTSRADPADSALQSTSRYAASCSSGCAFAATDGKDLGVDTKQLNSAISGAIAGTPDWSSSMKLAVKPGSTRAVVSYLAPSGSSCTLKVYTNMGRTTLHADTDTSGEEVDSRSGNITDGRRRQFALGGNTALTASTQYWAVLACGAQLVPFSFRTLAAGQSGSDVTYEHPTARTMRHSANADMSGATELASATAHVVPVPAGAVRYAQTGTTGPIDVLVAP